MITPIRRTAVTVGALGALGLGGAAIAGAAGTSAATPTPSAKQQGAHPQREALAADVAAKVKAAALAKVPGATVERAEAGGPYGTPYHAHITPSGATKQVVLVDASFNATDVVADQGRFGRGGRGPRGNETPLTGTTKEKVEAAVLGKYPGATIERTETNGDAAAPYESHVTTKDGEQLEVLVSKDFTVVDARRHP